MSIFALTVVLYASPADVYRHALPSVAWVHSEGQGRGTGWIVDAKRRWLLTCYHLTGENDRVTVFFPVRREGEVIARRGYYLEERPQLRKRGLVVDGKVIAREPTEDLALVELESLPESVRSLSLAEEPPKVGSRVQVLGNRYDMSALWGHSLGTVRGRHSFKDGYYNAGKKLGKGAMIVEADVPINEADSGGPLLDAVGQVVGLVSAVEWKNDGMGLFVDVSEMRTFLGKQGWKEHGKGRRVDERPTHTLESKVLHEKLRACSVTVRPRNTKREASGWLVDGERRIVLTTAEVIGDVKLSEVEWFTGGEKQNAITLMTDRRRNLALLEVLGPVAKTTLEWVQSPPSPGEFVHTGSARKLLTVAVRQCGTADLRLSKEKPFPRVVFLQAEPNAIEGGSVVIDGRGFVVGIATGQSAPQQQLSYALDRNEIRELLDEQRAVWNPTTANAWIERGRLYQEAKLPTQSVRAFTEAIRLAPEDAIPFSERGLAYVTLDKLDLAEADGRESLRLAPKLSLAHLLQAKIVAKRGEVRLALDAVDMALSLDRKNADTYTFRASLFRRLERYKQALDDIDEALWLDRTSADIYLERSRIHFAQEDWRAVLRDLDRAIALDPRLSQAWVLRANAYWRLDDVPATLEACKRWCELEPTRGRGCLKRIEQADNTKARAKLIAELLETTTPP